jgi:hypothetical protein
MKAEAARARAGRRYKRLTNITVSEVSSVDRGAGQGCEVRLVKHEGTQMPVLEVTHVKEYHPRPAEPKSPVSIAKSATAHLTSGGDLDQNTAAKLEQRLAMEMFPTLPLGKALNAWWATPAGAELQNAIVKRAHIAVVCANPSGNGFESVAKDMCDMDDNQDGKHPEVDDDAPWSAEKLMKRANELKSAYEKLDKPARPMNDFINEAIREAQSRNPRPISP